MKTKRKHHTAPQSLILSFDGAGDPEYQEILTGEPSVLDDEALDSLVLNLIADCYISGKTMTYGEFLAEASKQSGYGVSACAAAAAYSMQTMCDRIPKEGRLQLLLLSTFIVDEKGKPRDAYFKFAVQEGHLAAGASDEDKLKFWQSRYKHIADQMSAPATV